METNSWYSINAKAKTDATQKSQAEISIYDEIGAYGISAKQFAEDIKAIDAEQIHLRLNTPGGDVFDGTAIHNALVAHPAEIIVHVDGVAASAGSFIAMSGDEVRIADNAYMMIHNAQGGVIGEAADMRHYADVLEMISNTIAGMYAKKAGKPLKHWRGLMDAETWFTADDAIKEGLADTIEEPPKSTAKPKAKFDFTIYNKIPDPVRRMWGIQNQPQAPEPSPRGEASPVLPKENSAMADTPNPAPAPAPVAAEPVKSATPIAAAEQRHAEIVKLNQEAINAYIAQGQRAGVADGVKVERDRAQAIVKLCEGKPDMAIAAILGGQTPESAKLAYDAIMAADARAKEVADAQAAELARWQALAASGGYPGGVPMGITSAIDGEPENGAPLNMEEARIQATNEWEHRPQVRRGFSSKQNYVNGRAAELTGKFQLVKAS